MKKDLFAYKDYKSYLAAYISSQANGGRGLRISLARHIGSPVSHISQVLNGKSNLSLEQAEGVNEYLGHTQDEAQYFFLLVQLGRAGTPALRKRLNFQIQQVLEKRLILKDRFGIKSLTKEDQMEFYSSWVYAAVHMMLTIPKYNFKEAIAQHLGLSLKKTGEILEFLVSIGLAQQTSNGKYEIGQSRIHLGSDSHLIATFHTNWRVKAIQSLSKETAEQDLHYSSAITISDSDFIKIKSQLVKYIEEIKSVVKDSPAEGLHCFSLDFFRLP